jgi:hypothetical protein
MGKGGSKDQETTTKVELPPWVDKAAQENLGYANTLAQRPFVPNPWTAMAGFSPEQEAAYQGIVAQQGAYKPWLQQGASPAAMIAGSAAPSAQMVGAYMNPYTQQVIDTTATDIERARQGQIGGIKDAAHAARAFGGDRQAIAENAANRAAMETTASTSAQLRSQGYQNAMDAAKSDLAMQLGAGDALARMAQQGQGMDYSDLGALEQAGAARQGQTQGQLDMMANQWQQAWDYPLNMLQMRASMLGQTPYGQTSTGTQPMTRNTGAGILGGAASGAATGSMFGPWGMGIGALGGAILGGLG